MADRRRVGGVALALFSLALTVTGVVLAATDPNPAGAGADPLSLNGYPPHSAQLHVVISTGQQYNVSADLNINFDTNAVSGRLLIPMFFSSLPVDVRLVGNHLYVGSPNLASVVGKGWVELRSSPVSLYGVSLELTKPDLSLISGFTRSSVTRQGVFTTHDYQRDNVHVVPPSGFPLNVGTIASIDVSVTTGQTGEVTAAKFTVTSKRSTAWIALTVESYNHPARISAPPASQVVHIDRQRLGRIFSNPSIGSLLSPGAITSLSHVQLS
jgi:hypothetical protein